MQETFLSEGDMGKHLEVKGLAFDFVDTIGEFQVLENGDSLSYGEDGNRLDEFTRDHLFGLEQLFTGAIYSIIKEIYP